MNKAPANSELNLVTTFTKSKDCGLQLLNAINKPIDWDLFLKLAIRHRLFHQIYPNIKDVDDISNRIKENLAVICQESQLKLLMLTGETLRVYKAFYKEKIKHYFIKGIVLSQLLYNNSHNRPCKDIDIWVEIHDIPKAIECLNDLGYIVDRPTFTLTGKKYSYYTQHAHDISLYHKERRVEIELHFSLNYCGLNYFAFDQIKSQTISLMGYDIPVLAYDYDLLYLMMHAAIHSYSRLRWLYDIALYLKHNYANLDKVLQLAKELKCEHIVMQSISLANKIFNITIPGLSTNYKLNSKNELRLVTMAESFINADYEFDVSIWHKMFFKYRIYLLRIATPGTKTQVFFNDMLKLTPVINSYNVPDRFFRLYYLLYPVWIIKNIFLRYK